MKRQKKYLRWQRPIWLVMVVLLLFVGHVQADDPLIVDESGDFAKLFDKSDNIGITGSDPEKYGGDNTRFFRNSASEGYITYSTADVMTGFKVETWYNQSGSGIVSEDMLFFVSADDEEYEPLADVIKTIHNESPWPVHEWRKIDWESS